MNMGLNCTMKGFQVIALSAVLALFGCVGAQSIEDPTKEANLAKTPIGLHVQKIGTQMGMTHSDITVRNNSGQFINMLYVEVLVYDGENRVGMTNHIFSSVNVGETMVTRNPINSSGRPWDSWRHTYKIQ